ncbi:T9SS type A sorting domain-containing protein [Balneolaceae bacterium YR4-1]|uniref:T9SS type A sorting domain-containing protein n=1 Tax=Halalkalibaculum roseum TaxID=2709311 RepID=A0A6M1T7B2_9BACT|nr:lamin tail domain-containing protein [Halalkalibaculum roseum]NGP76153.1 T9SS type A sorting domain-containing protein [Halalkalibaculum roseum]
MGYTLPRTKTGKGFISFVLSLIVAVIPVLCPAQSSESPSYQQSEFVSNETTQPESYINYASPDDLPEAVPEPDKSNDLEQQVAPVISFTVSSLTVKENIGTVNLNVELLQTENTGVEVEIIFLQGSSSATSSDLSDFRSESIYFNESDVAGTVKTLRIPITNDSEYEQSETAVFRLQSNSSVSIAEPSLLTLVIQDDDTPSIIINEIFANPMEGIGDANGDGVVSSTEDQFVELVNTEGEAVDISGWTLSDDLSTRFTFPSGTVLQPGRASVVFGGGEPAGNFGGATVFTADNLGIDNSGDKLILRDNQDIIVEEAEYTLSPNESESLNRGREDNGNFYVRHSEASEDPNKLFSPGTRIDGTSFGSRYALRLGGGEGWRLLSSPTRNTTFKELLGDFQMNTTSISNRSDQVATLYEWREGRFQPVENLENELEAGKGYAVYFSRDDNTGIPGVQGGFPKVITTDNPENSGPVPVTLSTAEFNGSKGWNLMGNPFGTEISVEALLGTLRRALQIEHPEMQLNGNVYVWDPSANAGNGDYLVLEENESNKILPFQAFWVKIDNAEGSEDISISATLERDEIRFVNSSRFKDSNREEFSLNLTLGDGTLYDDYQLSFNSEGTVDTDIHDAFKLHSINTNSITLYSLSGQDKLMKNVLPYDLDGTMEIPIDFDANGREELRFEWGRLDDIPDNWNITLTDRELNKEINLRSSSDYRFTVTSDDSPSNIEDDNAGLPFSRASLDSEEPRFILTVRPGNTGPVNNPDIPESVKLNPNYPNPFNPATTISYELKEDSEVLLSIWNIVGQRVVTLVDGMQEAGQHTANWNASEMPSGIYIAQLEVGGQVFIRKMTLIK